MKSCVDSQLGIQGITGVHIQVLLREVAPNYSDKIHLVIERGSSGKIGCSASQGLFFPGKRCFHGIQGHRTNNQNGQLFQPSIINYDASTLYNKTGQTGVDSARCSITPSRKARVWPNFTWTISRAGAVFSD